MHIHILGICGTFMGGIAALAREAGHTRHRLRRQRLSADERPAARARHRADRRLRRRPARAQARRVRGRQRRQPRGNPLMEAILDAACPTPAARSGWPSNVLQGRGCWRWPAPTARPPPPPCWPGSSSDAGLNPGFLVGGVPQNFGVSARLGPTAAFFVIEADEYDTAFFDKRSQVRPLPPAHRDPQQPRVRPRRHLPRPGRDRDASSTTWCAPCRATAVIVVNGRDAKPRSACSRVGCWSAVERFGARRAELGRRRADANGTPSTCLRRQPCRAA